MYLEAEAIENIDGRNLFFKFACQSFAPVAWEQNSVDLSRVLMASWTLKEARLKAQFRRDNSPGRSRIGYSQQRVEQTMDFDQLTTFLEVAKLGSFSRAGQKVFRSQSAVSTQVRQLEQTCGARLLDRSGKDVTLTPAGRVLFTYAERMLRLRDEALLAVADDGKTPRGSLSIGANEGTCLYVLPDVFAKYSSLHPGVQINIYRNFTYKIVRNWKQVRSTSELSLCQ